MSDQKESTKSRLDRIAASVDFKEYLKLEFRHSYRSVKQIWQQAEIARAQEDFEKVYVLLMRVATMYLDVIAKHPQCSKHEGDVKEVRALCKTALTELEKLREIFLRNDAEQVPISHEDVNVSLVEAQAPSSTSELPPPASPAQPSVAQPQEPKSPFSPLQRLALSMAQIAPTPSPPPPARTMYPAVSGSSVIPFGLSTPIDPVGMQTSVQPRLRTVVVDPSVFSAFLSYAAEHTRQCIEFCGILCGVQCGDTLQVSTILLPDQHGTEDTCTAMSEETVFQYQEPRGLLTLGWIHTHPTQDAFLSSVDQHTHLGYQLTLPEAIAVVLAPRKSPDYGIFNLTEKGLATIQTCAGTGFHEHKSPVPLYDHVPHVRYASLHTEIVDLRAQPTC